MPNGLQSAPDQPLVRLLYTSRASPACLANLQGEIAALMRRALRYNSEQQITGALVAHGGWFVQVLEGPEDNVHALFRRICLDPRHVGADLVFEGPVAAREFASWGMCALQLSALDARILTELDRKPDFDPRGCAESHLMDLLHAVADATAKSN